MSMKRRGVITAFLFLIGCSFVAIAQDHAAEKEAIHYDQIDDAVIYDHDPSTKLGDDVFGTIIADLKNDAPGRCSHGGPVCLEYPNGDVLAFYANTTDHNSDGWSEYALSKDGGKSWKKYNKLKYSYEAYKKDRTRPVWVEKGLVTQDCRAVSYTCQHQRQEKERYHQEPRQRCYLDGLRTHRRQFRGLSVRGSGDRRYQLRPVRS